MKPENSILIWDRQLRVHGNSMWLSIPNEYVRTNNMKPGARVRVILLRDGNLRIERAKI